jgi:hypothetical protein
MKDDAFHPDGLAQLPAPNPRHGLASIARPVQQPTTATTPLPQERPVRRRLPKPSSRCPRTGCRLLEPSIGNLHSPSLHRK